MGHEHRSGHGWAAKILERLLRRMDEAPDHAALYKEPDQVDSVEVPDQVDPYVEPDQVDPYEEQDQVERFERSCPFCLYSGEVISRNQDGEPTEIQCSNCAFGVVNLDQESVVADWISGGDFEVENDRKATLNDGLHQILDGVDLVMAGIPEEDSGDGD